MARRRDLIGGFLGGLFALPGLAKAPPQQVLGAADGAPRLGDGGFSSPSPLSGSPYAHLPSSQALRETRIRGAGAQIRFLRVESHAEEGDLGGAIYRFAAEQSDGPGRMQSRDGSWWEIAEPVVFPQMVGVMPSERRPSASRLAANVHALNTLLSRYESVFFPHGDYWFDAPLVRRGGPFQLLGEGPGASRLRFVGELAGPALELDLRNAGAADQKSSLKLAGFSMMAEHNGNTACVIRGGNTLHLEEGLQGPRLEHVHFVGADDRTSWREGLIFSFAGVSRLNGVTVRGAREDYSLLQRACRIEGGVDYVFDSCNFLFGQVGIQVGARGFSVEGVTVHASKFVVMRTGVVLQPEAPGDLHNVMNCHFNVMQAAVVASPPSGNPLSQLRVINNGILKQTPRLYPGGGTAIDGQRRGEAGTVRSATRTGIELDDDAAEGDLAGRAIFIERGAGEGQYRRITAYDAAARVATVDRAWDPVPNESSVYRIEWIFAGLTGEGLDRPLFMGNVMSRGSGSPYDVGIHLGADCSSAEILANQIDDFETPIRVDSATTYHVVALNRNRAGTYVAQVLEAAQGAGTVNQVRIAQGEGYAEIAARDAGYRSAGAKPVNLKLAAQGSGVVEVSAEALVIPRYTSANLPPASPSNAGGLIFVSDAAPGTQFRGSTGSSWVLLN